ncbi:uncharacterized protein LOC131068003 isoform X1 [Cryptomeria japonica]|uniref:uncharacterized protein LOC131068003 isoform X1 n=1 Tax=Cryptomeria japonica TaxID=3369 RepID=UPI0027DA7CCB|nr:uncharacterized protein LOC131068003 isoform X1 [Cryptomeria japonica]
MAYVPPHRRVQSSSKPEIPALSFNRLYNYPAANDPVFMWFPVDENVNPPANVKLEFKPCPGRSFPYLKDKMLYSISVNPHSVDDVENDMRFLMINATHPWRYTCEKIKGDLRQCFQRLENHVKKSKVDYAKPAFTIRFGKILFHSVRLPWHECVSLYTLEKIWKREISHQFLLKKIFDRHIPKDLFEALKEKTITSLETPALKEKVVYIIMVGDNLNSSIHLRLTCRKKDTNGKQLELKKVYNDGDCVSLFPIQIELDPLKHFVADTSCLNKVMDWRLLGTEKYQIDLHEEDKESILGIVNSARIEVSAKGGLQWPNGGSVRNRFKATEAWTLNVTTIVGKTWDMKFQQANRVNLKDSSGTVSNEIDIKLKSITKYLRDQRQWEEDNIMKILEDSLKWFWMEGLQERSLVHKD